MATLYRPTHFCWICGQEVSLEKCRTDKHGSAVHEACYVARMNMETEFARAQATNRAFVNET